MRYLCQPSSGQNEFLIEAKGGEEEREKRQGDVQLPIGLPYIVKVHDVRMVNQLHDDDLPLNPQQHLLALGSGFRDGHARGEDRLLGDDLDCCVLARLGVFGELDPTCKGTDERGVESETCFLVGKERKGRRGGKGWKVGWKGGRGEKRRVQSQHAPEASPTAQVQSSVPPRPSTLASAKFA